MKFKKEYNERIYHIQISQITFKRNLKGFNTTKYLNFIGKKQTKQLKEKGLLVKQKERKDFNSQMHIKSSVILFSIIRLVTFAILIGVSSQCYKQHWCDDSQTLKTMVFSILGLITTIIFFACLMTIEFELDVVKKSIHVMMIVNNILFYLILNIQKLNCPYLQTVFILYLISEIILIYPQLQQVNHLQKPDNFFRITVYLIMMDLRIILNNYYQKSVGDSKISTILLIFLVILCCLKLSIVGLINEDYLDIFLYLAYATNLLCSILPFFCSQSPSDVVFCGILAFIFISIDGVFSHYVLKQTQVDRDIQIYYGLNQIIGFAGIMFYSIDDFQNHSLKTTGQLFMAITILSSHIIPIINIENKRQEEVSFFISIMNVLFAITLGCLTINGTAYFVDNIVFTTIYGIFTLVFTLIVSSKISDSYYKHSELDEPQPISMSPQQHKNV